jgi:hypothetical protein
MIGIRKGDCKMITLEQIEKQAMLVLYDKRKELGDNNALYAACPSIAWGVIEPLGKLTYFQLYKDNKEALDNAVMEFIHNNGIALLCVRRKMGIIELALKFHLTRMLEMESVG